MHLTIIWWLFIPRVLSTNSFLMGWMKAIKVTTPAHLQINCFIRFLMSGWCRYQSHVYGSTLDQIMDPIIVIIKANSSTPTYSDMAVITIFTRYKQRALIFQDLLIAVEGRLGSALVSLSVCLSVCGHSSKYAKMTLPQHGLIPGSHRLIPKLFSHWLRVVVS